MTITRNEIATRMAGAFAVWLVIAGTVLVAAA